MTTKAHIQFLKSLSQRSLRTKEKLFVAEGSKVVEEFIHQGLEVHSLYIRAEEYEKQKEHLSTFIPSHLLFSITSRDIERVSSLTSTQGILGVFHMPAHTLSEEMFTQGPILLLDTISDPGNMGTIIRTADWFGMDHIICSPQSVDIWNPKVVQSTMGSLGRVKVYYEDLQNIIESHAHIPVFTAVMEGTPLQKVQAPKVFFLLMGNESHGVSPHLRKCATTEITIPHIPHKDVRLGVPESLNVAIATSILLAHFCLPQA